MLVDVEKIYAQIAELGFKYQADKIVLFGSRARGDNRERSDIDIAVFGLSDVLRADFLEDIDQLPTLLEFDVVQIKEDTNLQLLTNIEKDGVTLYDRQNAKKLANLVSVTANLQEFIDDHNKYKLKVTSTGVIKGFEICEELAWKTVREYLLDQGYHDINSPKSVMRKAFADELVDDESGWIDLINDRNDTTHGYDEKAQEHLVEKITSNYLPMFQELVNALQSLIEN